MPVATDLGPGLGGFSSYPGTILPPLEDRRGRRLYIGNLPPGVSEAAVVQFFNGALLAAAGVDYAVAAASGQFPVLKAEVGPRRTDVAGQFLPDHGYCFVEFRTIADATICLKLDGISFNGYQLKVGRPNDYIIVPKGQDMSTPQALASGSVVSQLAKLAPETKVYATDLPATMTEAELRRMCEAHGSLRSVVLLKDLSTGQSLDCGVIDFEEATCADAAIKALNGQAVGDKTVKFTKGPLIPTAVTQAMGPAGQLPPPQQLPQLQRPPVTKMSSVVTELPTSMTHRVFTNAIIGAQVQAARREGGTPSQIVQLLNCVYPEDLIKDEDYQSILEDIKNEASTFGTILNVVIPRPPADLSFEPGVGKVFIHFADITAARKAQAEMNGRRFEERRVICAAFYPLDGFLKEVYTII